MAVIHAYAAKSAGAALEPFEYDPGPLADNQVEVAVTHCGICHSDLSMLENEWGMTAYPLVPGHEASGVIAAMGSQVKGLKIGQRVGVGWQSGSCMACPQCMGGDHNLCPSSAATIVGHHGGFADRVRCDWQFAVPLPDALKPEDVGPLFCGGVTVFNPMLQYGLLPTHRIGVIGIGGLGHMALQFANKWGCEVTAFTSSESKRDEAIKLGAHNVVNSRDSNAMSQLAGSLDYILSTVNVPLDWQTILGALAPKGKLLVVGAVLEPIPVPAMSLIMAERAIGGSPIGSPATIAKMLDFCARHKISPQIETFPMSKVNEALEHLKAGNARYRIVLENDFAA
ncbi:NAD(P)-dependent alcohol dehydrogenase [Blastopirellula marina]|uniref:alcohol dehydrogenase (NADP(+)) n=1 Tax=Blastopirellula marina TaxID=124 RepID=A0A2S8GA72_9BACT|nr:NAD(P)-dependent alcohol dehydrogenase [Blastopirellula marina]PQO35493.1 alcohol dehydrogenase [Blastopirellula marina]PQO41333.1 alcohol dehydrogenase [Blastopirellula marina]PTL44133.1 NAD(P)-dependent alcohol dehydrogenase [Blastopirellula marina]